MPLSIALIVFFRAPRAAYIGIFAQIFYKTWEREATLTNKFLPLQIFIFEDTGSLAIKKCAKVAISCEKAQLSTCASAKKRAYNAITDNEVRQMAGMIVHVIVASVGF